jgi:hypothetical protein
MSSAKPVRIIDISRKLNLSTSTIIEFLEGLNYPVERSHHTPLLPEIFSEITKEFASGNYSQEIIKQFAEESKIWEKEHVESAEKFRQSYKFKMERMLKRRERSRKVIEGRERARQMRVQYETRLNKIATAMRSTVIPSDERDGRIRVNPIQLEIIQLALALETNKKINFLKYLRKISDFTLV